jgi:hypothetical protein
MGYFSMPVLQRKILRRNSNREAHIMTFEEFDKYRQNLAEKVRGVISTKGKEYANSEVSRFDNFDRLAKSLGLKNFQVGWVYASKHLDSIANYCRTQETHSTEPIEGRIVDAIAYLMLIGGMIAESQKQDCASDCEEEIITHSKDCAIYSKRYCDCGARLEIPPIEKSQKHPPEAEGRVFSHYKHCPILFGGECNCVTIAGSDDK